MLQNGSYEEHAVDVVQVAMLPSSVMDIISGHADLRAIEYGRLERNRVN